MKAKHPKPRNEGFTLIEIMIAIIIMVFVVTGTFGIFILHQNTWYMTSTLLNSSSAASEALEQIVYGVGTNQGLRAVNGNDIAITFPLGGWRLDYDNANRWIQFNPNNSHITDQTGAILCVNVATSTAALVNGGCELMITVTNSRGGHYASSQMNSFVHFRN